ncbi:MAG: hypothetical protein KGV44_06150 [Flavobacteriaceae bacterium]|nr:hypothetical protein [Flavobacteriaceae bacterium]
MKNITKQTIALFLMTLIISCHKSEIPSEPTKIDPPKGLSWSPKTPTPDKPLEIYFNADEKLPLYNYKGNVYAHIGIVDGGNWNNVPAEWNENIDKCKMQKIKGNIWKLTLQPTIRKWFKTSESQVIPQIGLVIRGEDGSKKGIEKDSFIPIKDPKIQTEKVDNQPLPSQYHYGINVENSSVTLVLYDKDKNGKHYDNAYVLGSFNDWKKSSKYLMKRDESKGVWWLTINDLDPNKEYSFQYYLIGFGKTLKIADPYSEKVLTPDDKYISQGTYPNLTYPKGANGIVTAFKINKTPYQWKNNSFAIPEKKDLIIYEVLIRDFSETGNIKGLMQNLDYITSLGVNAIELMPVQEFDGNDSWGYNPCFYFALDKAYGTPNDYKKFIDECHKRGVAVIFDVVYNHTTALSPLAKLYWDNSNNRPADNNPWLNTKAPHPYSVFEDFNHKSNLTQNFIKRNLKFLLEEYKIDGFRFDLSKGFTQNHSTEATAGNYDRDRVEILSSYYDAIASVNPNAYVILEHFADHKEEKELAQKGCMLWRNMNHNFAQSAMGYANESSFKGLDAISNAMPLGAYIGYMESHDEERIPFKQKKYGVSQVKQNKEVATNRLIANASFFFLNRNAKMIWQFEELGYDISIDEGGRTGKKTSYLSKKDEPTRAKLYKAYQKLIQFRLKNKDLFTSTVPFEWEVSEENWNNLRTIKITKGAKKVIVLGNFDPQNAKSYNIESDTWKDILTDKKSNGGTLTIEPNEVKVLVNFTPVMF